jgi:tetratricopeptide (TPR) repeat protein
MKASLLFDHGDMSGALAETDAALRLDPRNKEALLIRGNIYNAIEDPNKSIAVYDQIIAIDNKYALAYFNRAISRSKRGEADLALSDLNESLRLDPNYAPAYLNRGMARRGKGEAAAAVADYDEYLRREPDALLGLYDRSIAKVDLKDWNGALSDLNRVIELKSDFALAYQARAGIYEHFKYFAQEEADYARSLRLSSHPVVRAMTFYNRALMWRRRNELSQAIGDFNDALLARPRWPEALFERSIAYGRKGDAARAKADLDEAVNIKPDLRDHPRFPTARGLADGTLSGLDAPEAQL